MVTSLTGRKHGVSAKLQAISRICTGVLVAGAYYACAASASADRVKSLGSPPPGSEILQPEAASGCGKRFKFLTHANIDAVARYFEEEGRDAGLNMTSNNRPGSSFGDFAILIFGEKGKDAFMTVTLANDGTATSGSVYYVLHHTPQCSSAPL